MNRLLSLAIASLAIALAMPATAGDAKGTVVYKGRTADVRFAYFVMGPDAVTKATIRRLILSTRDLGAKIAACGKMSCMDSDLDEGLEIDLVDGPRFNYWLVMNGQKIQYSGTEPKESLAAKTDDAKKLAGTLRFDKTAAGGPKVDVEFDAPLAKAVTAP